MWLLSITLDKFDRCLFSSKWAEYYIVSENSSMPPSSEFYLHHSEATTVLVVFFFTINYFLYFRWCHAVCPLWIRLFSLGMASDLSICCASVPFYWCMNIPFIYLFFWQACRLFPLLTVINKAAAINILAHIFLWTLF